MATTKYIINNFDGNLSAQTINGILSATTYYGDGSNLSGIQTSLIEDVTYSQLWDKIENSSLNVGRNYRITDYRTINFLHGQQVVNSQNNAQTIPSGSFDPSFVSRFGFSDSVHAIKEVELGSAFFSGSCKITLSADSSFTIGTSDFTIEWFQYYMGNRGNNSRPFSIGEYPTAFISMSFETGPLNYFWWNQNGTPYSFNLNTTIENTWTHFVVQRSGSTLNIFQDGQIIYTGTHGDNLQNNEDLIIGNESNGGPNFEGYITNFKWTANRAVYDGPFDPITKPLNPEDDTVMLFKTMTKNKLLRNSFVDYNLPASNNGSNSVEWSKETPFESERKIYIGGGFNIYEDDIAYKIARLNQDGSLDKTFNTFASNSVNYSGFNDVIKCIEIQDDGKILVGGNFSDYAGQYCGYLVRLLEDGSQDPDFETSIPNNGFDGTVRVIVPLPDRSMIVGGSFQQYTDEPSGSIDVHRISILDLDGRLNTGYTLDNGYGFNNSVYDIKPLDYTVINSELYVGGDFTDWTDPSNGTITVNRIIQLDSLWNYNPGFNIQNGGFNNRIFEIAIQDDGKLVVVGGNNGNTYSQYTYSGNNYTASSIIRLNSDASVDTDFLNNVGSGFDSSTYSIDLLDDQRILIGGAFENFNATQALYITILNTDGTLDTNFSDLFRPDNWIIKLRKLADNNVLCGGWFSSFYNHNGNLGYIAKYITSSQSSGFVWSGTNVGQEEKIIVKAASENSLDPIALSEDYPQDVLEYNPYVRNLGRSFEFYNSQTLPDSTLVTGFDFQWDGSKVYFDMPSGYTIALGRPLKIYASFDSQNWEMDVNFNSAVFNRNQNGTDLNINLNGSHVFTRIRIVSGGTRVYLEDLSYVTYTAYDPDSLNVATELPLVQAYGLITNREDTIKDVSVPFDFRNVKFRRYEMNLTNNVFNSTEFNYYGITDNFDSQAINCTGRYYDFFVFGNRGAEYYEIDWKKNDYSFNSYHNDNNVMMGSVKTVRINSGLNANTILNDFILSEVDYLNDNVFNIFSKNKIVGSVASNRFRGNFFNNSIKDNFNYNVITGEFNDNNIDYGFSYNNLYSSFINNNVRTSCSNNLFQYTVNNQLGNGFSNNRFYGTLINSNFTTDFSNNIFSGACYDVNVIAQYFSNNNVRTDMRKMLVRGNCSSYDFGFSGHSANDSLISSNLSSKELLTDVGETKYLSLLSGGTMVYLLLS